MRKLAVVIAMSLLGASPGSAEQFSSPTDVLSTLYEAYLTQGGVTNLEPYFSDRLTKAMGEGRLSPEIMEAMGVDPLVGASGANLTLLQIGEDGDSENRAVVNVSFNNRALPVQLRFELVREPVYGWQIDHLEGKTGDVSWCSRSIVEASKETAGAGKEP